MKARKIKSKKISKAALRELISSFRGKYKRKPGEKPFAQEWAEYKDEEKALEEAKLRRYFPHLNVS